MMHLGARRDAGTPASRQQSRMEWRAAGAQFYPGGAYEQLSKLAHRSSPEADVRSDELLKEIICEQLADDPRIDAGDVSVEVERSEVTLHGTVRDREQRNAIEDLIADVVGVNQIHNHLSVADGDESEMRDA